jgi:hypothetical protein
VVDLCEHGIELTGSVKGGKYLDQLSEHHLKTYSVTWCWFVRERFEHQALFLLVITCVILDCKLTILLKTASSVDVTEEQKARLRSILHVMSTGGEVPI